jgi:hypothetical protein
VIEEPFYVTYDASALHVTATDTPSQVETSTIAATLTNRGSVDITDSAVAYLVWWDTDEDGVFGPGDYYVDTDGLEKPYSEGDSMVTATTYGVDVSATSTYTPPPVLVSNAGMTQTGYYMVTATWATVDGWTIDTSETTFYSSTTTRALLTYEDPDRTIESTSFPVGASNYTKATGLTPGSSVVFVFVRSDDTTYGVTATVDYDGTAIATYTIDPDDPIGAWRVDLFRAGEVIASTPFLVVYDAFIIELHVTDAASQGDEAAITTRLSNRGIVDIMDSEVEYLVWWDEDGDGFLSAGDSYLDQDGVEQVYSGTGAVYSVLLTGIDVSAGTTVTPGTVLIPGDSLSHTGIHRVSEVWRTSSGVTIDTAEATFYVGHMTRNITLYRDADRLYEETTYTIPGSVYPEVTGLTPGAAVTFVFNRSDGTTYSVPATVAPDGSAIATYTLLPDDPTGWWTCEVVSASGDLLAEAPFYVTYSGEITALFATDAPNHDETVSVEATVTNTGPVAITDSSITYVIWWDSDGDGLFGMGDIYIDEHGDPYPWDGASAVHTHITTGVSVNAGASWGDATWAVSNHSFPEAGTWRLTATWTTSYGALIDQKTTTFDAIPALGWILFGFVVVGAAMAFGRRLKTPDGVTISGRPQWL